MKTCRVMRMPVQAHMNYAILKNFNDHMQVLFPFSYMELKQVLRNNRQMNDLFTCCFPSKYRFKENLK